MCRWVGELLQPLSEFGSCLLYDAVDYLFSARFCIYNTGIARTCILLVCLNQRSLCLFSPIMKFCCQPSFYVFASVLFRTEMCTTFTLFCMIPCLFGQPFEIFYLSEQIIIRGNDINHLFLFGKAICCPWKLTSLSFFYRQLVYFLSIYAC